jgi:hypothetical protein
MQQRPTARICDPRGIGVCLVITGRLVRLARRLGLDRNPLRRRTDRIETWIMVGLLVVFLIATPLSWFGIGRWVQQGGLREQRAQQSWRTVPAVVVKGQREQPQVLFRLPMNTAVPVLARWRVPGGQQQAKLVAVPAVDARTGSRVQVWVDSSGRVTGPPLEGSQLTKRVIGAQVLAELTLVALVLGLAGLARWQLNRRRLADWESDWATTGPGWTRHR